ncbi:hypothetical protein LMK08_16710 [Metapseudomonas furukawaii]|uniref:Nmad5 family putative nucleotide modification protein n=1 Tax=Metapseudomonas furukawaii TaxID=1149133 RepID=UPI00227B24B6|nr:Nmad5 family putative nucleotide modification protein [Pseudomonas furukawaii]WAG77017.1 hypothetical protein LMK08_16710 [Pseudomonas furukawaii]
MSKSFPISNDMRKQVADQLTVQAVAKHGPRIAKALAKMNAAYWDVHMSRVDRLLTLDRSRWSELIGAGMVAAITNVKGKLERDNLISFGSRTGRGDDQAVEIRRLVLRSKQFEGVARFIYRDDYYSTSMDVLWFVSECGSVPRMNGMEQLEGAETITKQAAKIKAELKEVFDAAEKFRDQVLSILISVRTSRQLVDLFPEAAALLPQPVKNEQAVAPVELVDSVRGMLNKGVPPIPAKAA